MAVGLMGFMSYGILGLILGFILGYGWAKDKYANCTKDANCVENEK